MKQTRPVGPGFLYGALSVALVMVVGFIALSVTNPPPPTVAEFAPQALEQITDAPLEQSSDFGQGGGGLGQDGLAEPTPVPDTLKALEEDAIQVPRVKRCVGDPPRQIEDPQSPPCVPYWDGDNGGTTYKGVSGQEIRIAAPQIEPDLRTLEAFFNRRFEFYGRRISLVDLGKGGFGGSKEQEAAAAVDADHQNVFASLPYVWGHTYHKQLARRGIASVVDIPNFFTDELRAQQPYVWQYPMATDDMLANLGEWACNRFAGRTAKHAGDPQLKDQKRVFGAYFDYSSWEDRDADRTFEALERELAKCGERLEVKYVLERSGDQNTDSKRTTEAIQMKTADVTTIFCLCNRLTRMRNASVQAHYPEWLVSTYYFNDKNSGMRLAPREQAVNTMGITFLPRQVPVEDSPAFWAMREINPEWNGDVERTSEMLYRPFLLLASGLQMAGPRLTPETFRRGLHQTAFPNPAHRIMAGAVGFQDGSYTMTTDAAEFWWSETARSPHDQRRGSICYVEGGKRHRKGQWPEGPGAFFEEPCDS